MLISICSMAEQTLISGMGQINMISMHPQLLVMIIIAYYRKTVIELLNTMLVKKF